MISKIKLIEFQNVLHKKYKGMKVSLIKGDTIKLIFHNRNNKLIVNST